MGRGTLAVMRPTLRVLLVYTALFTAAVVFHRRTELLEQVASTSDDGSSSSNKSCETPFGTLLGWANGVPAYSNCHDHHTSYSFVETRRGNGADHRVVSKAQTNGEGGGGGDYAFTGMRWQCVEYARRYLWIKQNVTFGSVEGAEDIFKLSEVHDPLLLDGSTAKKKTFVSYRNSEPVDSPRVGDVLIWPRQEDMPYGHVGIVVALGDGLSIKELESGTISLFVADQNYRSVLWEGRNYSMELQLGRRCTMSAPRCFPEVVDPAGYKVLGWMRVAA